MRLPPSTAPARYKHFFVRPFCISIAEWIGLLRLHERRNGAGGRWPLLVDNFGGGTSQLEGAEGRVADICGEAPSAPEVVVKVEFASTYQGTKWPYRHSCIPSSGPMSSGEDANAPQSRVPNCICVFPSRVRSAVVWVSTRIAWPGAAKDALLPRCKESLMVGWRGRHGERRTRTRPRAELGYSLLDAAIHGPVRDRKAQKCEQ